jgi:hypothetical protein
MSEIPGSNFHQPGVNTPTPIPNWSAEGEALHRAGHTIGTGPCLKCWTEAEARRAADRSKTVDGHYAEVLSETYDDLPKQKST